jgi:hypothetical protein
MDMAENYDPFIALAESACDEMLASHTTVFAKLVALASLREKGATNYSSAALPDVIPAATAAQVLARRHERAFREWLQLGLEYQHVQLTEFLAPHAGSGLPAVLQNLSVLIPATASTAERRLFTDDLNLVLDLIDRN